MEGNVRPAEEGEAGGGVAAAGGGARERDWAVSRRPWYIRPREPYTWGTAAPGPAVRTRRGGRAPVPVSVTAAVASATAPDAPASISRRRSSVRLFNKN